MMLANCNLFFIQDLYFLFFAENKITGHDLAEISMRLLGKTSYFLYIIHVQIALTAESNVNTATTGNIFYYF